MPHQSRFSLLAAQLGQSLSTARLRALLHQSLGDHHVALCLHRVGAPRASSTQPECTIAPGELDALVELLLSSRPAGARPWLTLAFDDGYEDAARYVQARAARWPWVEFLLFVCPEKAESGAGFQWDAAEVRQRQGMNGQPAARHPCPLSENQRPELRELGRRAEFALATPALLRELQRLPNVALGNHTNCHFMQSVISSEASRREFERSHAAFTRLFGPQAHFAFPFGVPGVQFGPEHVQMLRAQGDFLIWTTEPRPFQPAERAPGAVLPRFPINGTWSHRATAGWLAARALQHRVRGAARSPYAQVPGLAAWCEWPGADAAAAQVMMLG